MFCIISIGQFDPLRLNRKPRGESSLRARCAGAVAAGMNRDSSPAQFAQTNGEVRGEVNP